MESIPDWQFFQKTNLFEKRLEFTDYQATRDFLDKLGTLSEQMSIYPDISFSRTHAVLTLSAEHYSQDMVDFAIKVNEICG